MKRNHTTNQNPDYLQHMNAINTVYRFAGLPVEDAFPGLDGNQPANIKKGFLSDESLKHHVRALNTIARYADIPMEKVVENIRHYQQMQHYSEDQAYTEAA